MPLPHTVCPWNTADTTTTRQRPRTPVSNAAGRPPSTLAGTWLFGHYAGVAARHGADRPYCARWRCFALRLCYLLRTAPLPFLYALRLHLFRHDLLA